MASLGTLTSGSPSGSWTAAAAGTYTTSLTGTLWQGQLDAAAAVGSDPYACNVTGTRPVVKIQYRKDNTVTTDAEFETVAIIRDIQEAVNFQIGAGEVRATIVGADSATSVQVEIAS